MAQTTDTTGSSDTVEIADTVNIAGNKASCSGEKRKESEDWVDLDETPSITYWLQSPSCETR